MQNTQLFGVSKAVISAAGRGSRMKHLTKHKPKHMILIRGKPFLYYIIENLRKAGLKDIIVVIGYKGHCIEKFIKTLPYPIRIVNQYEVLGKKIYGTACPIKAARKFVGDENFISVAGDNFYEAADIKRMLRGEGPLCIGGKMAENPEEFGVLVSDENGNLVKIVEKPKTFVGNIANASLQKFTPEIFDAIDRITPSSRGEYELVDAINLLARKRKIKIIPLKNFWIDFGRPGDIITFSNYIKNRPR